MVGQLREIQRPAWNDLPVSRLGEVKRKAMADQDTKFPDTYVSGVPVWAKRKRRRTAGPLISFIVVLLALFGAVVAGTSLRMGSVEKGGRVVDGWIAVGKAHWDRAAGTVASKP